MAITQLKTGAIADDAVTTDKLANAINTERTANTAKVSLGADSVTGAKIADDAVGSEHIEQLDADLSFADSAKAKFGAGNDLEIYHNGTNSYITNATGGLNIAGSNVGFTNVGSTEWTVQSISNGAVELYYDGTKQCETAADGLAFPSGKGINFNATSDASGTGVTAGSELLDDYEEGTFSPLPSGASTTFTYAYNNGWYQKVGNTVTFQIYLMFYASSIVSGNGGNPVSITGLPFTIKNNDRYVPAFTVGRTYNFDIDSDKRIYSYGDNNTTNIRLMVESDDTTGASLTVQQVDQATCLTFISGTYQV